MNLPFASIFLPDFALQAALRQEPELREKAVALVDPALPKPVIVQVTPAARTHGVEEGLTPSQAMARCAELLIRSRSLPLERSATDVMSQLAYAFAPNIEETGPGVCTLELKGLGLNHDLELQAWSRQIVDGLSSVNLQARLGIAATPALALLAARAAEPIRVVRESREFVSALPVTSLEPPAHIAEILDRWGIRTVGELLRLGRTELAERLGPEILPVLERVSISAIRPLKLVAPKTSFDEEMEFETEVETAEPLLFVLRRFVEQLSARLNVLHLVIAQLHLQLKLASGQNYQHLFRIPSPTGEVNTLFRMVQTHLEAVRTESPIVGLRLEATPCLPHTHQFGLFETTLKDPNQFAETLARLAGLCGSGRVGTPVPEMTHRPDSFRVEPPQFDVAAAARADDAGGVVASAQFAATGLALRRLRPAVSALVEFRGKRPALLRSSAVTGAIVDVRGPFRSSGDWWDRHAWHREEWDVQVADGTLCRIYRSGNDCFVEGVYD